MTVFAKTAPRATSAAGSDPESSPVDLADGSARTAITAPAATTNLCDLPGGMIDAGDLGYEGDELQVIGCQGMINGAHTFNSLTIQNGTLVHSETMTMSLTINNNVLVDANSAIDVSGRGYAGGIPWGAGDGPGGGQLGETPGGGGGHGGYGGARAGSNFDKAGIAYGDVYRPVTRGSGGSSCYGNWCDSPGGDGGSGGGAVHLDVGGTLSVDGSIRARGGDADNTEPFSPGAGGAGGSIWLEAATLTGSGLITADGGDGADLNPVGGGGGRIAVYYGSSTFSGSFSAQGGYTGLQGTSSNIAASPGTIYLRDTDESNGHMIIYNEALVDATAPPIPTTPLDGGLVSASEPHNFTYFDIQGTALVSSQSPVVVELGSSFAPGLWAIQGGFAGMTTTLGSGLTLSITAGTTNTTGLPRSAFDGSFTMDPNEDILVSQGAWLDLGRPVTVDEVVISAGSRLGQAPYRPGLAPTLELSANSITIEAGSQINVNGRGYPGGISGISNEGEGPGGGEPLSINGSGGGYGGPGGHIGGGITYGSATAPIDLGSGGSAGHGGGGSSTGNGGSGGGRVHLMVSGALSVDGGIYANGSNGQDQQRDGGGGSGGSIWIEANTVGGNGVINAQGGSGWATGGGGGGGRIALDIQNNNFNGTVSTRGGSGGNGDGGTGTIIPGDLFSLSKSATPDPVVAGEVIVYTLQVNNNSTETITATIVDTLPPQVVASGSTSWVATIPSGASWTETLSGTVAANASGTLTNLLEATVGGTTRAFTLQTWTEDAAISGLSATNSGPAVETQNVVFNAAVAGGSNVDYSWDFGDGQSGQGATAVHAYSAVGNYTATVSASNNVSSASAQSVVSILEQPSFAGLVWHDLDGDGRQGPGEAGLDGVSVTASGAGAANTSTANGGQWRLEGLAGGTYALSAAYAGYEGSTANPFSIALPAAGAAQADFGLREAISPGNGLLSGRIFVDINADGLPGTDEPLVSGETITLRTPDGSLVDSTVSDSDGLYSFAALNPAVYQVEGTVPAGYYPSPFLVEGVQVVAGQQTTVHMPLGQGGSIAGLVETTSGVALSSAILVLGQGGLSIDSVVTASDGVYGFGPLPPGDYELSIVPPATYLPFDGSHTRAVSVANNVGSSENWTLSRLGSLRVIAEDFIAANMSIFPVSGIYFNIEGGGSPASYATSFDGEIFLEGLNPGVYTITYQSGLPAGATISPNSRVVSAAQDSSAEARFNINLTRLVQAICRERGEAAYSGFPCTVEVEDPSGTLVSQVLPGGGAASFTDLSDGSYTVRILPDEGSWPSYDEIVVVAEGTYAEVNYPYNPSGLSSLQGYAFKDKFWPFGTRSSGTESSYADANGLTVNLLAEDGTLVASTSTESNYCCTGYYRFAGLTAGLYRVEIELPDGYNPTSPTWDWRSIDLQTAAQDLDFGFQRSQDGQISGRVYYDYDGDGSFTEGLDNGRGAAAIELRTPDGSVLDSSMSAPNGDFEFSGVPSGEYRLYLDIGGNPTTLERPVSVPFENPSAYVEYALRPPDRMQRFVVFLDSDMDGAPDAGEQRFEAVTVSRDDESCGLTFEAQENAVTDGSGVAAFEPFRTNFYGCARVLYEDLPTGVFMADPLGIRLSRGSDLNWMPMVSGGTLLVQPFWDANGDGQQGYGEPVLSGIPVSVGPLNGQSAPNGASFMLPNGTYNVSANAPANMTATVDQPQAASVSAEAVSQLGVPMSYLGSISGAVLTQGGDPTWPSLSVMLSQTDGAHSDSAVVSPGAPNFQFSNMPPGTYLLSLSSIPAGWGLLSQPVFYYPAEGLVVQPLILAPLEDVSGVVYIDKNGDGSKHSSDPTTDEYQVSLVNNLGTAAQSMTPASDGSFTFTNLQPGVLYALTLDLGTGPGQPGASITDAPGWFAGSSSVGDVSIGVFPYEWPDEQFNVVYGQVSAEGGPLVGAEVGYYAWDAADGCENPGTINGKTLTDANGGYQLQTLVLPFIFPDGPYYCVQVTNAPGYQATGARVVEPSYTYATINGLAVLSTIIGGQGLVVEPISQANALAGKAAPEVLWSAFRDDNANGARDPGEAALPGTILRSESLSSTAGLEGRGALGGLEIGKHILTVEAAEGYLPIGSATLEVWMNAQDLALAPLGMRLQGALSGSIFADNDGDGWQAADEHGLGALTVTLSGPAASSFTTNLDGTFLVEGLPDGEYSLAVSAPAGFAPVEPQNVILQQGAAVRIPLVPLGQVSGVLYEDWDGDARRGSDEPTLMTPLTVTLGTEAQVQLGAGRFLFWDAADGSYELAALAESVLPATVQVEGSRGSALALPNVGAGIVRGRLWYDQDGDGVQGAGETPISGALLTLDDGQSSSSDAWGRFQFYGAAAGTHQLRVSGLPEGLQSAGANFITTAGRGAAVGIAVGLRPVEPPATAFLVFLPNVNR